MIAQDLGLLDYEEAWRLQEAAHDEVVAGGEERLLLVEHPPVITFGRRAGVEKNLVASADRLREMGVRIIATDRGGDITFHGPGQLVAYPIIRLNDHRLSVGGYVHMLERAVTDTLARFGVVAQKDACAVGVWVEQGGVLAKVCAIGVRIRRGVSLHGLALNVSTDLRYFNLIVPCGLAGRPVTSLEKLLGPRTPPLGRVKEVLLAQLNEVLRVPASAQKPGT